MDEKAFRKMMDDAKKVKSFEEGPLDEETKARFNGALEGFQNEPGDLIKIMRTAHELFGHLPQWAMGRLSMVSGQPVKKLINLAQFLCLVYVGANRDPRNDPLADVFSSDEKDVTECRERKSQIL